MTLSATMREISDIKTLIDLMARLPGLGPRSARRVVIHLIRKRTVLLKPLAELAARVAETARECARCGNFTTHEICNICRQESRATGCICVVAEVADLWAIERTNTFKGRYHVLGGILSAVDTIQPEDLRLPQLIARIESGEATEVILALTATNHGQTTAHYIADMLGQRVKVTRLGLGVPVGGELEYLDEGTIQAALDTRLVL